MKKSFTTTLCNLFKSSPFPMVDFACIHLLLSFALGNFISILACDFQLHPAGLLPVLAQENLPLAGLLIKKRVRLMSHYEMKIRVLICLECCKAFSTSTHIQMNIWTNTQFLILDLNTRLLPLSWWQQLAHPSASPRPGAIKMHVVVFIFQMKKFRLRFWITCLNPVLHSHHLNTFQ